MFEKSKNFYNEEIRIVLIPFACIARNNPNDIRYQNAAQSREVIVSVLQGSPYEGVYVILCEQSFSTPKDARRVFDQLVAQNPDATIYDFLPQATE